MALLKRNLYLLAREQKKYPIKGDVLVLSQQAVYGTLNEVKKLFKKEKVPLKNLPLGFDTKNKIPAWGETNYQNYTNCQTVLSLFGAKRVFVADISDYENPDILMDLNIPVKKQYHNKFDVILDIGSLEHIFNIPQALENIKLMLKPEGTVILDCPSSNAINHGFYQISPTLFFDYFTLNGFKNFSCFILEGSFLNYEKGAKIYQCKEAALKEQLILSSKGVEVMFFATKGKTLINSSREKWPIQSAYRVSNYWNKKTTQSKIKSPLRKIILWLLFATRKYRPELIDRIWKRIKTKKKLIYIGRH